MVNVVRQFLETFHGSHWNTSM